MDAEAHAGAPPEPIPAVPPVTELGAAAMVCIATGVIFSSSYLPRKAPLAVPIVLCAVAALLVVASLLLLSRVETFAWWRFRQVAGWALLAYAVIGGMIEYAFVYDHTRGSALVVLTALLVLFVLTVPLLIGFTVARFQSGPRR
jgi:hypothetical protein